MIDDHNEYEIDEIIKKRTRNGKTEYLVKWRGYHMEDSTWEPTENLSNAKELVKEFNRKKSSRNILTIRCDTVKISGRNLLKSGDGLQSEPTTKNSEITPPKQPKKMFYYWNPVDNNQIVDRQIPRTETERHFEYQVTDQGETIRTYSIKKFIEVTSPEGEKLVGYANEEGFVYFYRPAMMRLVQIHTGGCDCNMCLWVTNPPSPPRPKLLPASRSPPYNYGRRTKGATSKPSPTDKVLKLTSRYSPKAPTPEPEEYIDWSECKEDCDFSKTPQWPKEETPADQTRELDEQPPLNDWAKPVDYNSGTYQIKPKRNQHRTAKELNDECTEIIEAISKYPEIKNQIIPDIPQANIRRTRPQAYKILTKLYKIKDLLDSVFNGHSNFQRAYTEWVFYNQTCGQTKHYSPETYCPHCQITVLNLEAKHKEWINQTVAIN